MVGVGVLLTEWLVNKVVKVERVNKRLILEKLVIGKCLVIIISASEPQVALSEEGKDTFWDMLQDALGRVPPGVFIFLEIGRLSL
jgi:hypothetical protein